MFLYLFVLNILGWIEACISSYVLENTTDDCHRAAGMYNPVTNQSGRTACLNVLYGKENEISDLLVDWEHLYLSPLQHGMQDSHTSISTRLSLRLGITTFCPKNGGRCRCRDIQCYLCAYSLGSATRYWWGRGALGPSRSYLFTVTGISPSCVCATNYPQRDPNSCKWV